MKWNTKSLTNISDALFTGRFNGVDIVFEPGETRYLPSHVSDHLAGQLMNLLEAKQKNSTSMFEWSVDQVLGSEILTADSERAISFKEELEQHEEQFVRWQEERRKAELLKKEKALEIADERPAGDEALAADTAL